jgi:NAD(P)-dependent dehydrogenase (short-subunit alcohol dehydrogenase family)
MEFDHKTVLITGGATGIGRALAVAIAERGANVAIADVDTDSARETAARVAACGRESIVLTCDVADRDSVAAMTRTVWDSFGPIDLVCANAGVGATAPLLETSQHDIDWMFGVNLFGALNTARAFATWARGAGRPGHILFTGSEHSVSMPAFLRRFGLGIYNMTKHALLAMAEVLRHELQDSNIGISLLMPGPVQTEVLRAGRNRQARFGGPFEAPPPDLSAIPAGAQIPPAIEASTAARVAIEGLRRGDFFIPTHAHIVDDVRARYDELMAAFNGRALA